MGWAVMPDRILTAEIAEALQDESARDGKLLVWIVTGSDGEFLTLPVAAGREALSYVLVAGSMATFREQLPAGLALLEKAPGAKGRDRNPMDPAR